eukprot:2935707-Prymnesium_polylepis.1
MPPEPCAPATPSSASDFDATHAPQASTADRISPHELALHADAHGIPAPVPPSHALSSGGRRGSATTSEGDRRGSASAVGERRGSTSAGVGGERRGSCRRGSHSLPQPSAQPSRVQPRPTAAPRKSSRPPAESNPAPPAPSAWLPYLGFATGAEEARAQLEASQAAWAARHEALKADISALGQR